MQRPRHREEVSEARAGREKHGSQQEERQEGLFLLRVQPGATNLHSCIASTGKLSMIAANSATFTWVKKASKTSV